MGHQKTITFGEFKIRTGHTPRQGWQGWVIEDGKEVYSCRRMLARCAAMNACKDWIKEQLKQRSAV